MRFELVVYNQYVCSFCPVMHYHFGPTDIVLFLGTGSIFNAILIASQIFSVNVCHRKCMKGPPACILAVMRGLSQLKLYNYLMREVKNDSDPQSPDEVEEKTAIWSYQWTEVMHFVDFLLFLVYSLVFLTLVLLLMGPS